MGTREHAPAEIFRREMLRTAGQAALGLSLGGLLRARAAAAAPELALSPLGELKSCIFVFWYGGPSQLETWDPKPLAPSEVRGEFQPIATSAEGVQICEHLPRMARLMHKVALIRSMHHRNRLHDSASIETFTGRPSPQGDREEFSPIPQVFPSLGSVVHYLRRERQLDVPHAVVPCLFHNVVDVPCQGGGLLGARFDPLEVSVDPATGSYRAGALNLPPDQTLQRIGSRRALLAALESGGSGSDTPATGQFRQLYDQALTLLGSQQVRDALDLSREAQATRERYGFGAAPASIGEGGGGGNGAELGQFGQTRGQNLLIARRLVESGVPFVNVNDFRQQGQNWDAHYRVFSQHKNFLLPLADQGLSALIEDLDQRGLLDSTLVIALGEFGRTPQINREGGRDHWPDCYSVVLAGGGVRGGYVHGASDRIGAYPAADPVTPADLAATIFWRFGLDPTTEVRDPSGRPFRISEGTPITGLFG